MDRSEVIIPVLALCFILGGCTATIARIDGSTEEELKKFNMSKDQIWDEAQRLKAENQKFQRQLDLIKRRFDLIKGGHEKSKALEKQIGQLKEQIESERAEKSEFERKISMLEQENRTFENRLSNIRREQDIGKFKVKVLSGDGDIRSARQMAARLKNLGYKINSIDRSPIKTFERHTVFFAVNSEEEAKRLVTGLGGRTISKPLTWSSIFDFIVVTGKNP